MLGVKNTGDQALPELAFTIFTDKGNADGSFNYRSDQPGLANPNRPVWVLENKYPRPIARRRPRASPAASGAQTNTFGFGPLDPGETKEIVWRLTPVKAGSYTSTTRSPPGSTARQRPSPVPVIRSRANS